MTSFEEIVTRRQFTPMFDPFRDIDRDLLEKLLKYSQTAPSSFNLQPFKMIVIRDIDAKVALSECMLGANGKRVLDAPISLIYVSDKEPIRLTRNLMACETAGGADPTYVNSLPAVLGSLFGNGGWLATKIRTAASHLASPHMPAPVIPTDLTTWSIKNTIFAAQTFMLACTAANVSTAPMEGFDERRICNSFGIPSERYTVPVVISVGYAKVEPVVLRKKKRYPLSDICYENHFGKNMVLVDHLR
jgi:nitroreductase